MGLPSMFRGFQGAGGVTSSHGEPTRRGMLNNNRILSHASETGSPTNRSGSDKTRGQGSFGGPDLQGS